MDGVGNTRKGKIKKNEKKRRAVKMKWEEWEGRKGWDGNGINERIDKQGLFYIDRSPMVKMEKRLRIVGITGNTYLEFRRTIVALQYLSIQTLNLIVTHYPPIRNIF